MRKVGLIILLSCFGLSSFANHITGGEMYYTYTGLVGGNHQYAVTLKLYQRCNSGRQFPNPAIVSVFDRTNGSRIIDIQVPISNTTNISITQPDPCISNPPNVCYDVAYYNFVVSLPASSGGYVLATEVNYRINGITNLVGGQIGATYSAEIPGTLAFPDANINHSANFIGSDLVVVCANNSFSYSFAAVDGDQDELRYSFCNAYTSSNASVGGNSSPAGPPPFTSVPYNTSFFSGTSPLGGLVQINSQTGMITGTAPDAGIYVVTVCVEELRQGKVIATQRKDLQINVADCNVATASLLPEYLLCENTQTITIANQSNSPLINSYHWEMIDAGGNILAISSSASLTHTFSDTGLYTVKLAINRDQPCTDSTTALVRVYPGFVPGFTSSGICITKPTSFTDITTSVYGIVNSWSWDFGENTVSNDISSQQHPVYTYPSMGIKNARLLVKDSKGCYNTFSLPIEIIDKPPISFAFRDTLICNGDILTLQATGSGNFSWTPLGNITGSNTSTPNVSPTVTTKYYATLDNNGCINKDSVMVRVVDFVSLTTMADTIICSTDTIQLRVYSDALRYSWNPASQLLNPFLQHPLAVTPATTDYVVSAFIGGCSAMKTIRVRTIPYPTAQAGADTTICYNTPAKLKGVTDGRSWIWSPAGSLNDPGSLTPVASPIRSTSYIFQTYDNRGCPKPGRDTVVVYVSPKIQAFAGRDTAVIIGQQLQLSGTGGVTYQWWPPQYLSSSGIPNPVAIFPDAGETMRYKLVAGNGNGCFDSAYINIRIFASGPEVFIPTGFTPNGDGKNDLLIPVPVGIQQLVFFKIFSRWGQEVFTTSSIGKGWDGRINGQSQGTNTYVWVIQAIDFLGKPYFRKGVVTLIR